MNLLARLIAQYALWIYVLCAIGILAYLRAAVVARREGAQAIYSLEREASAKRVYRASGMIVLLMAIVLSVYALSHYVELPAPQESPIELTTPTPGATPTPPRETATVSGEATPTAEPTATRRPRVTTIVLPTLALGTPTTAAPPAPASCPHANVQVLQPGANQVVDAGIAVLGTATKENFDRYEFKFQSRDFEDEWHWVQTFRTPVENGDLGYWQTAHLPNGNYRFMLIAIDRTGNSQECVVPVTIQH
ncbi:MAG: hypothetical protein JXA09_02390 [Anaerolineae bacterium]|nr:hypothetical protein [Anaerolineae bacterium]